MSSQTGKIAFNEEKKRFSRKNRERGNKLKTYCVLDVGYIEYAIVNMLFMDSWLGRPCHLKGESN